MFSGDSKTLTMHERYRAPSPGTGSLRTFLHPVFPSCVVSPFPPHFSLCESGDKTRGTALLLVLVRVKSHRQGWVLLYEQLIKRDKLLFAFYACLKMECELIVLFCRRARRNLVCI